MMYSFSRVPPKAAQSAVNRDLAFVFKVVTSPEGEDRRYHRNSELWGALNLTFFLKALHPVRFWILNNLYI